MVRHDGEVVGRGLSFPDQLIGIRWRGNRSMQMLFMSDRDFVTSMTAADATVEWLD